MSRAEWLFDPDAPEPGPDATSVGVLVSELACTSGQGVGDRLRPPDIRYGDTTIVITFFAEPLPGGQDCQGSPPKPVTVNLREPIGTRAILDGSFYPPSDPRIPRP